MRRGLTFDDVLLVPTYNDIPSRRNVDTSVQMGVWKLNIPVISSNMDTVTGPNMAHAMGNLGGMGILHRFMSIEQNIEQYLAAENGKPIGVSLGLSDGLDRAIALSERGAWIFCVDIAHGHSKAVSSLIKSVRENLPDAYIIAGNVATYHGAQYLTECGADAVKVGIGPGSVCSTRTKTGFGVPQITAIQDCSRSEAFIIADGGIRTPGDAVKALAAGADAIMLGGMLAGTDEAPGAVEEEPIFETASPAGFQRRKFKVFRGMASKEAQEDHFGSMSEWKAAEGVQVKVPYKGPVSNVIADLMGGIRSGMTYCGARTVRQLKHKAEFMEITRNGHVEGTPHYGN